MRKKREMTRADLFLCFMGFVLFFVPATLLSIYIGGLTFIFEMILWELCGCLCLILLIKKVNKK